MTVRKFYLGGEDCNSYVLGEEGGPALLIDIGALSARYVFSYIKEHHSRLEGILLTHGHCDHIGGLALAPEGVPVFMGQEDIPYLFDEELNLSETLGEIIHVPESLSPYPLEDVDETVLPSFSFKTIATPFHTPGSLCFLFKDAEEEYLFTGDTLFRMGIGRTDFPGGQPRLIRSSLEKLWGLNPNMRIYPGHQGVGVLGKALEYAKRYY